MKDLANSFQSDRFADVDVVIRLGGQSGPNTIDADSYAENDAVSSSSSMATARLGQAAAAPSGSSLGGKTPDPLELKRFPGHTVILSRSDYFDSQVMFQAAAGYPTGSRPTIDFTVEDATHVPSVEAIIVALYGMKDSVASLEQHQLVLVIQYADMMQLDLIVQEAVDLLVSAAKAEDGLPQETFDSLCQFAWPDSATVMPLLQALAKSVGTNLEVIWADKELSSKLLKLPLPAIRLLLSSDHLKVYSEDTVMYTAAQYVVGQQKELQIEAGRQLSQIIRVPHLSDFQLSAQAVNRDQTASNLLLCHQPSLQVLSTLKRYGPVTVANVLNFLPIAPNSWRLPARKILRPRENGVELLLRFPVDVATAAYNKCRETRSPVMLHSATCVTAPVSRTAWSLLVVCRWDGKQNGVVVGVFVTPALMPAGVVYKCVYKIEGPGVDTGKVTTQGMVSPVTRFQDLIRGKAAFFACGAFHGDLEILAWVDKGLPATGSIELKLAVYEVS